MPSKKRKFYNSGILSNSYIPPLRAIQIERELQKLPPDSLFSLTQLWLSITATQPIPDKNQKIQGYTKESLSMKYKEVLEDLKKIKSKLHLKKQLINLILVKFYPRGLNTLQLAQIDVQLLVDRPGVNSWVSSTVKMVNSTNDIPAEEDNIEDELRNEKLKKLPNYTFSLNSQQFLDNFIMNLANLYLTHVYISRHPHFPLLLIRVQMYDYTFRRSIDSLSRSLIFDLTNTTLDTTAKLQFENDFASIMENKFKSQVKRFKKSSLQRQIQIQNQPQFRSHKPFYILLPISSPHVIHSATLNEDVSTKLILQTLETTLSNSHIRNELSISKLTKTKNKLNTNSSIVNSNKIKIFRDSDVPKPIKNLNTIFLLKGISRFGSSLGAWAPYADGDIDMGIFDTELKHLIVQPENYIDLTEDDERELSEVEKDRKIIAGLKFKGSLKKINPKKLFSRKDIENEYDDVYDESIDANDDDDGDDISIADFNNNNTTQEERQRLKDPYASLVPVQETKFEIENDILKFMNKKYKLKAKGKAKKQPFSFSMELLGTDVFGGLHELAVNGSVDPVKVPSWLTGDSGTANNIIKNGKVKKLN